MIRSFAVSLTILTALLLGSLVAGWIYQPASPSLPPVPRAEGLPSFDVVAARARSSVVSIVADSVTVQESLSLEELRRLHEPFGGLGEDADPWNAPIEEPRTSRETRSGTGVVVDGDGHVVTNFHVVQGAQRILVRSEGRPATPAVLVGADPETDLALLKMEPAGKLTPASFADSADVRVGEWVLAIGDPLSFQGTVTVGVVSGTGRRLGDGMITDYIQTDAAINVGNSGGPLLNSQGEVIGINTAISRVAGGFDAPTIVEGVGFAIPSNTVSRVLEDLRRWGRVPRGFLGISIEALTPEAAEGLGIPDRSGVLVTDVRSGWPAESAGLKPGDVVLEVQGRQVQSPDDLIQKVSSLKPDSEIRLLVYNEQHGSHQVEATLADRGRMTLPDPDAVLAPEIPPSLSAEAIRLGFDVRDSESGLPPMPVVESVDPLSRAWDEGIRPGARILELQDRKLKTAQEFSEALESIPAGTVARILVVGGDWGPAPRWVFLRTN